MSKLKFTLTIYDALIEKIKILAFRLRRGVSDITEELYWEFIKRRRKAKT